MQEAATSNLSKKASGKALDVSGVRTAPKTPLWIWPKSNPGEAQKFKLKSAGTGYYRIIPKINTRLCVSTEGMKSSAGTGVWTFQINGSNSQHWKFIEVKPFSLPIIHLPFPSEAKSGGSSSTSSSSGSYVRIPKSQITGFANLIMRSLRLRLNNFGPRHRDRSGNVTWYKGNDSYVRFGGRTTHFDIQQYTRGVRDKMYFVNDVNLSRASTSFEGNKFVLTLRFEESGTELKGMCSRCAKFREDNGAPDYQINGHTWKIYLKLIPYNNSIAFQVQEVKFLGDVDGQVFGELFDGIVQRNLIPIMRREIIKTLNAQRSYIAREIKNGAEAGGYRFENVRSVYADGNNVTILTR